MTSEIATLHYPVSMPLTWSTRPGRPRLGESTLVLLTSLLATVVTLSWAFRVKSVCGGGPFSSTGRSALFPSGPRGTFLPCYSDIMQLWVGRDIDQHVFPYIHGGITPNGTLFGGVVEYPVLSGLLMWVGATGADTDLQFLQHSALLLAPFAIATTVLLAAMTRWWVLLWAATPPIVLYAFHNWELPVVFTAVAAVAVMAYGLSINPRTGQSRLSLRTSAVIAAAILGVGFSLKLYPGFFVLPLALYVLTANSGPSRRDWDWRGAGFTVGAGAFTAIATQAPFMLAGYDGWRAALTFQGERKADLSTNSIWYWGLRYLTGGMTDTYNTIVGIASPLLVLTGFTVAAGLGWRTYRRDGVFPWLGVCAAMLAAFMLFHKVHSPQYTLWLLPFFVMLRVRWWIIAVYLISDFVLDVSIFRLFGYYHSGANPIAIERLLAGSVWTHAVLLAVLIVGFVRTPIREPLASYLGSTLPPKGPMTRLFEADDTAARAWIGTPTLQRGSVTLRPLAPSDAIELGALVAADDDAYRWTAGTPTSTELASAWIASAHSDPARVAFAVVHNGAVVGSTSFYDVRQKDLTLSIGYTFYGPEAMGTEVNPTAKFLLLEHAFTTSGAVRVEWHTHENNARSRAAISKLGAHFEGLLRKHRRFDGGWRTTAQYSMTDDDWRAGREKLLERAARS